MAVRILSPKGIRTIDWFATKRVQKGEIVRINAAVHGFTLAAGRKDTTIPLVLECDLVEVDNTEHNPGDFGNLIKAGNWIIYSKDDNKTIPGDTTNLRRHERMLGILHNDARVAGPVFRLMWKSD